MKRTRIWLVGIAGLAAAALGYCAIYAAQTAKVREMEHCSVPDLAWLKMEFHLSDAEFQRVSALHDAYKTACAERCLKIDARNTELRKLVAASTTVAPEIERLLGETAKLRADCQAGMLKHFYEVSRAMPPEQGQRYLDWICAQTLMPSHSSMVPASPPAPAHEHSGH